MLNNNIFNVSNPMHILDALWGLVSQYKDDFSRVLIFLPSNRAIKSVEKKIVDSVGHAVVLPNLIPLGNGVDEEAAEDCIDIISNQERIIILAKLLSADANVKNMATALPVARDFVRMQDYLENEGVKIQDINWAELIDDKYANHFQNKARILDIIKQLPTERLTNTQKRNADIRAWIKHLDEYDCVIVCGSTASVPATADLMEAVAKNKNGKIILSGKISGRKEDFELDTNPYHAEYEFLNRLGGSAEDVQTLDVGKSEVMDVMNIAFSNTGQHINNNLENVRLIECVRESEEAVVVGKIASNAVSQNKSVLVITPDAAANQRIKSEMEKLKISADFSSGLSGENTNLGRAVLNLFDYWYEESVQDFEARYKESNYNLFDMLVRFVDENPDFDFQPNFVIENEDDIAVWQAVKSIAEILCANNIILNVMDARAVIADAMSSVTVRKSRPDDCKVCVIGTIESRMQTADVIILTGLNEDMFPTVGYRNAWLPSNVAKKIGLPSPNRKVSLMALDFMNLSCGAEVYWLRSKQSGGNLTTESRYLSRVRVAVGNVKEGNEILKSVREMDDVEYNPLDYSPPAPPIDKSDVWVTELDLLIHNPYAFYVRHILRLKPKDDYWVLPDARQFGNCVHDAVRYTEDYSAENLIREMDKRAIDILPPGSILFHFWHKRFEDFAPWLEKYLKNQVNLHKEIDGSINIMGRNVYARADIVSSDGVADIKTGEAPKQSQLKEGMIPQLPLEGFMWQNGGFKIDGINVSLTPILQFLHLSKDKEGFDSGYENEVAQEMIDNTVQKVRELFGQYSTDKVAEYEYREAKGAKYHEFDDLARVGD
ncbi:MAG: PD-(D/E)XK nuclease family protein [Alphaproteobacteria bacterium]|nr:PD-(D/E)XK nuclease family protein [Alphaproteobacteria bacterium]